MKKLWQIGAMVVVLWAAGFVLGANSGPAMLDSTTGRLRASQLTVHTHTASSIVTSTLTTTFVTTSALASTLTNYAASTHTHAYASVGTTAIASVGTATSSGTSTEKCAAIDHVHAGAAVVTTVAASVAIDANTGAQFLFEDDSTVFANTGDEAGDLSWLVTSTAIQARYLHPRGWSLGLGADSSLYSSVNKWHYSSALTVSFWVMLGSSKLGSGGTDGTLVTYNYNDSGWTTPYYSWDVRFTTTALQVGVLTVASPRNTVFTTLSTYKIPSSQWLHIAFTYDTNYVKIFLNGRQSAISTNQSGAPVVYQANKGKLEVGARGGTTGYSAAFAIRDLRIEDTVRSAEYLLDLYQRGAGMLDPVAKGI